MSVYPRRDCLVIETKKTFDMKKYVIIQLVKLVPFLVIGVLTICRDKKQVQLRR